MTDSSPASSFSPNGRLNKFGIPFYIALIVAGLAGNYFKFQVFLNVDFLFGSIFAMLALQFFGIWRAVLAAAIIAGYTWHLWNHPYAIIIMTAEAVIVGWLAYRRKIDLVLAGTIFWLFAGIPMVYLFYHVIMHIPTSSTFIVMTKQALNGICNVLIARLIFTAYLMHNKIPLISFREIVSNLLAFFVLCPALLMLGISSRNDFSEVEQSIRTSLNQDNLRVTESLESWLRERKNSIITLAAIAAKLPPSQMQSRLEQAQASDYNFVRISQQDRDSVSTAFSPLYDELGNSNIGISFADRPFIPELKQKLRPMLSEVIMGKVGIPKPRVLMLAPIVSHGEYEGYVAGTLDFGHIRELLEIFSGSQNLRYTLLDKFGHVITTNCTEYMMLSHFTREKGTLNKLEEGISQWIPALPGNISIMERWKKSFYIVESKIGNPAEWKLILEQPVAPFQKTLYDRYSKRLVLLFLLLLSSLAVAYLVGRRISKTTNELSRLTKDMPERLPLNDSFIWPQSGVLETSNLIMNFREMAKALTAVFEETRHINTGLERQVAERTKELRQAMEAADAANLAKSRFLSIVAHEFHTPLGLLTVSTDILDRYWDRLDENSRTTQHEQIRSAARQMSHLVNSVYAFNREETTLATATRELSNISALCRTIADEVCTVWSSNHDFRISIQPECGTFMLNRTQFRRMLENLLTNAFRFTPPGGTVSLVVTRQDDHLQIEISDTGIGIPEVDQQRIFEAFYRGTNIEARNGLGLGLSIVHEALQQLNGSITLTSKAGKGTTFRVDLPLGIASAEEENIQ